MEWNPTFEDLVRSVVTATAQLPSTKAPDYCTKKIEKNHVQNEPDHHGYSERNVDAVADP